MSSTPVKHRKSTGTPRKRSTGHKNIAERLVHRKKPRAYPESDGGESESEGSESLHRLASPTVRIEDMLDDPEIMAAMMDNRVVSLHTRTDPGASVHPIRKQDEEGLAVLRRTLTFIFGMANAIAFPGRVVQLVHDMNRAGYFFSYPGLTSVAHEDVETVLETMRKIVDQDIPISEESVRHYTALEMLERCCQPHSVKLVSSQSRPSIELCRAKGLGVDFCALRMRALAPYTGRVWGYTLRAHRYGVLLTFPVSAGTLAAATRTSTMPLTQSERDLMVVEEVSPRRRALRRASFAYSEAVGHDPVMYEAHREGSEWGNTLGISCVGDLNERILAGDAMEVVLLCEALQDQKLTKIARDIKERPGVRLVLIAGPSTSGKTTFANKLRIALKVMGLKPLTLSTDEYYRSHDDPAYPRDAEGKLDYEDVRALRLELLNQHINSLFHGDEVMCPIFDFVAGRPKPDAFRPLRMHPTEGVLIMEGIFSLQPTLTAEISDALKFKIYIAPMTQLHLDNHHFISNQPLRLIRRISRDYLTRGRTAQQTIARWASVKAGEERNIFPFAPRADIVFNSALDYELAVLKGFTWPLLATVKPGCAEYGIAQDLMSVLLKHVHQFPDKYVPMTSVLREFIGGSTFHED